MNGLKKRFKKSAKIEKETLKFPPDSSQREKEIISVCSAYTMTSMDRMISLIRSIDHITNSDIKGDFVECGVWRGGSSMIIAALLKESGSNRNLYMYDTFEGMTTPQEVDVDASSRKAKDLLEEQDRETSKVWAIAGLEEVEKNMKSIGYANYHLIKGDVKDSLEDQENLPSEIALLRLDTDWYESTLLELEVLYPRLSSGGILIIDDYGHWRGAKMAVDEYFSKKKNVPYFNRIDYTGRLIIKP